MNRFQPFATRGGTSNESAAQPAAENTGIGGGTQPTSFFTPLHYEPNYAYPLLIWLHGPGEEETQLRLVMPHISLRNYVAAAVRGTMPLDDQTAAPGYTWSQSSAHVAMAEQGVFEAMEAASRRFNIAPRRVFLAGHDCGGTMALRIALGHPDLFAGVLSLGGPLPHERRPFSRLADLRIMPVFLASGRDSERYPAPSVCDNLRLLHSAGMSVDLRQYPCSHEIMSAMLADMDRWIMNLVVSASSVTATPA